MHMVKVISLSEQAYHLLKRLKRKNQSFSDVVLERLGHYEVRKTKNIRDLIDWMERQPKRGRKNVQLSTHIDEILYGKTP